MINKIKYEAVGLISNVVFILFFLGEVFKKVLNAGSHAIYFSEILKGLIVFALLLFIIFRRRLFPLYIIVLIFAVFLIGQLTIDFSITTNQLKV